MATSKFQNSEVDEKILDIVERIRSRATAADRSYEREVDSIERRASYSIDISQMNVALEIIADSKKAMDRLYTTYESLVRTLDMQCRPLADQGASAYAIEQVYKLIAYMNSESSSLSGNFTASFNSYSLGDVGGMRYVASLEAQTIENFWETKHSMLPEVIEEKKRKQKAAAEAAKRREEQRKKEAAEKAERDRKAAAEKAERDRKAAEEAKKIEEANKKAKVHMDAISEQHMKKVTDFETRLKTEIQAREATLKQEIKQKLSELKAETKAHEEKLSNLGAFKFAEKKAEKQEIARLNNRILAFESPTLVANAIQEWESMSANAVEVYKKNVQNYLQKRFPKEQKKTSGNAQSKKYKYLEDAQVAQTECPPPPTIESVFQ